MSPLSPVAPDPFMGANQTETEVRLVSPDNLLSKAIASFLYGSNHTADTHTADVDASHHGWWIARAAHNATRPSSSIFGGKADCTPLELVDQLALDIGVPSQIPSGWLVVLSVLCSTAFMILYTKIVCFVASRKAWRRQVLAANDAVSHGEAEETNDPNDIILGDSDRVEADEEERRNSKDRAIEEAVANDFKSSCNSSDAERKQNGHNPEITVETVTGEKQQCNGEMNDGINGGMNGEMNCEMNCEMNGKTNGEVNGKVNADKEERANTERV